MVNCFRLQHTFDFWMSLCRPSPLTTASVSCLIFWHTDASNSVFHSSSLSFPIDDDSPRSHHMYTRALCLSFVKSLKLEGRHQVHTAPLDTHTQLDSQFESKPISSNTA
ncbi:hypothetical protein JAAARDRAFT_77289 [Jaapia argillacea MUCL 33604]|uniref:Uncharacterized protein n=1 Tax=Jaapia argillacea MUCL 33604 TaxID=933084 RepID=A0A067QBN5_9AGAM|nr:hypothetical protein JAAARDRAFT_77289 [Jaapia argillacea MUCL 33604]